MNSTALSWALLFTAFGLVVALVNPLVLLFLQARAFVRHRHLSFLLLVASTTFALLYWVAAAAMFVWYIAGSYPPIWLYFVGAMLLIAQLTLGIWGTAALFGSYRALVDAGPPTPPPAGHN
jgi:hypothetical protein